MRIFKNSLSFIKKFTTSNVNEKIIFPKCSDCKNYIKHIENGIEHEGLGKCRINGYRLESGPVWFYTVSCRNSDIYCGEKGKFFQK